MASEFRPNRKAFVVSFVTTFAVIGLVLFAAPMTRMPSVYSPRWEEHGKYYLQEGCRDCHRPFADVTTQDCLSSCHSEYRTGFDIASHGVYMAEWAPDAIAPLQKQVLQERVKNANYYYHDLPEIRAQDCTACHFEHIPPPPPDGYAFTHRHGMMLPQSVSLTQCSQCHTGPQVPPTADHAEYLGGAGRDCWACHHSTVTWKLEVSRNFPAGAPAAAEPIAPAPTPEPQRRFESLPLPRKDLKPGDF